ncbi:MAG TPA: FKBP-type peptidyl-prolyl cis-trans isomerase, partial [Chitinophagaceae bacterium]
GDRIVYSFKVADLFTVDSLARSDSRKEGMAEQGRQDKESVIQGEKEQKDIQGYLAAHKIDARKTPKGAWVVVKDPGTGMAADSGKLVSIKYRGQTFDGTVIDTNMDSSFHHAEPYIFIEGGGNLIPGLDDAIRGVRKGAKLTVYIPAVLGYGARPMSGTSKGYDNLIFDVELIDVKDRPEPKPLQNPDTAQPKKSNR